MKIVRYERDGAHYGDLRGEEIHPLEGAFGDFRPAGGEAVPLGSVRLLAPATPTKIVAVGPNYHAHLQGREPPSRPFLWIKPPNTVLDPEGTIRIPGNVPAVCHESELAIVIGRTARNVAAADAADYILGYTCINDVSAGQLDDMAVYVQSQYFVDGKICDTFAPFGPVIVTDIDPTDLRLQCRINGETRQDHRTSDQIWPPHELLSLISHIVTLNPGDIIATGSPPGPRPMQAGDEVEVEVEGIGILRNRTVRAS